jgi:RNA-directed DNA polymerase
MAYLLLGLTMKTHKKIYSRICDYDNLYFAYLKAKKGKTKKDYVIGFEKDLDRNLNDLRFELITFSYFPKPLDNFILKDPKTRKISRSHFRDRIVHHAIVNIVKNIFEKSFIYDSCANQIGKGNLFSVKRFEVFRRKVTQNYSEKAFCLKADIKHYFEEINHDILINIIQKKINDINFVDLMRKILKNNVSGGGANAKKECHLVI